jgi:hypothetical protein
MASEHDLDITTKTCTQVTRSDLCDTSSCDIIHHDHGIQPTLHSYALLRPMRADKVTGLRRLHGYHPLTRCRCCPGWHTYGLSHPYG